MQVLSNPVKMYSIHAEAQEATLYIYVVNTKYFPYIAYRHIAYIVIIYHIHDIYCNKTQIKKLQNSFK